MLANSTLELTTTESRRGRPRASASWTEVIDVLRVCLEELRFSPDLEVEDLNGEVCSKLRFSPSLEVEDLNGLVGSGEVYSGLAPVGTSTCRVPRSEVVLRSQ